MKLPFRVTVLVVLSGLIIITVAALGYNSYRNTRFATEDLSTQILLETSLRIDQQINNMLLAARGLGSLNLRLVQSGQLSVHDFPRAAAYFLAVMQAHPHITRLSLGVEANGNWLYVRRMPDGKLVIGELRRNPRTNQLELSNYWPADYPRQPFYFNPQRNDQDPRSRPWHVAAREAGGPAWSESYVLFGAEGVADVPGVSFATPITNPDGTLDGVLTVSFDLYELCEFLRKLRIGHSGLAFVVEYRRDGTRRVIAHPEPGILLRVVKQEGEVRVSELVPTNELPDPRVQGFLPQVPAAVTPHALEGMGRVSFVRDGVPFLGSYHCLSSKLTPDWLICIAVPKADLMGRVEQHTRVTLVIGVCVFAVAILMSLYLAAQIAHPLEELARETAAIGRFEVEARPVIHSVVREVDSLGVSIEAMKTGLRSFRKYVPADLVRSLLASKQEAGLGGECRTVTVCFSDIVHFTDSAERMAPQELVEHLRDYLSLVSAQISEAGGTVDKYIGDAVMSFWGAPAWNPNHALAACTAALRCQACLKEARPKWVAAGKPPFLTRIGLNTGPVVVGNVGSVARLNYTVIGDAVNLASRLEGLNKYYGTDLLISESTFREAGPALVARPVDWVFVKGKHEPVLVYELLGLKDELDAEDVAWVPVHADALARYRRRDWAGAIVLFEQVLRLRPGDGPAGQLLARCQGYQTRPPADGWVGVHRMEDK